MEFNGIPLHPLIVHATVVLVPTAALVAIVFAAVPRWRWLLRMPLLVLAAAAALATQTAALTGDDLMHRLNAHNDLVNTHQMWGDRLVIAMWVLAAAMAVAWWVLPTTTPLAGRTGHPGRVLALALPVRAGVVLLGLAVLAIVAITGDAGARAVWLNQ